MGSRDALVGAEEAYDLAAPFYDQWRWQALWRAAELPFVIHQIRARFRESPPRLLDDGCGTGWYVEQLAPFCAEVAGIDVSAGMLERARDRAPQGALLHADARELPFPDQRFEVVFLARVLSHLPDADRALKEMARVLTRGGLAIVTDVDAGHPYEHTRLPLAKGHVLARTFKHPRVLIERVLKDAGMTEVQSALISEAGETTPLAHLGEEADRSVAGWMSAWLK